MSFSKMPLKSFALERWIYPFIKAFLPQEVAAWVYEKKTPSFYYESVLCKNQTIKMLAISTTCWVVSGSS